MPWCRRISVEPHLVVVLNRLSGNHNVARQKITVKRTSSTSSDHQVKWTATVNEILRGSCKLGFPMPCNRNHEGEVSKPR